MANGKKTVWVLGTGFSKSLGGPLLADLLSHRGRAFVGANFKEVYSLSVYNAFWTHLKDGPLNDRQPVYWDHAEEYLDFLSTAASSTSSPRRQTFREIMMEVADKADRDVAEFWERVQCCVAAECFFTRTADPASEAWQPYFQWASQLREQDTIISFNYDLVLETMGAFKPKSKKDFLWPTPKFGIESVKVRFEEDSEQGEAGVIPIIKLHGSVNWTNNGTEVKVLSDPEAFLKKRGPPLIASPGPQKYELQRKTFKPFWSAAVKALQNADVIVFLGYRFPPSDAESRRVILNAIRNNNRDKGEHYLRVHTVLGPNVNHEHSVRLQHLLRQTLNGAGRGEFIALNELNPAAGRTFSVSPQPLYVEDFFTVVQDRELYGNEAIVTPAQR